MIKWLWAKLTGGELVYLEDHDGEVTLTVARRNKKGGLVAKRWWPDSIRVVTLLPDGTARGCNYVESWKKNQITLR